MSSNEIVVVGSCVMDFVSYATRLPTAGETILGKKFVTNFGGKGANQCVASARLGGKTTLVARVGNDVWGQKYKENLKKEKINDYLKLTDGDSTGIAQIIVSEDGQNQIVMVPGANMKLNEADICRVQDLISNAAVLVLQLETAEDVAIIAMKLCKGISILNGAPGLTQYKPELLQLPTIFCVNETEASIFAEVPVNSLKDAEVAADKLLSKGCNSVLITLGEQGAVYKNKTAMKFHRVSSPKVKCVDSTGAGDAFCGALAYLLANHKNVPIEKCIEVACFIAADSVTRPGTQISFAGREILNNEKIQTLIHTN